MKTKIVFVTQKMVMGGIEKALLAMLESLPPNVFDTTVIVMEPGGDLINDIPSHVKINYLFTNETRIYDRLWDYVAKGKLSNAFKIVFYTLLLKKRVRSIYDRNFYLSKSLPYKEEEFDLAIAYHIPTSFPVTYVINNIHARKKIAWIHSDVSDSDENLKITPEGMEVRYSDDDDNLKYPDLLKKYKKIYEKYDRIFCVSKYSVSKFNEVFPQMAGKTNLFYNIIDEKEIKLLANNESGSFNDNFKGIRILTVGRLGWEKGQDIIPSVLVRLLSKGYNVRWYCIGDGGLRTQLETMIHKYSLKNQFILLGVKENPYPFIKDCDLYIQPSRQEGYCITLAEARALNKPIITTNTGASEQIKNENTGLIVKYDVEEMCKAIKRLIDDKSLSENFIKYLEKETADTTGEINKLFNIV